MSASIEPVAWMFDEEGFTTEPDQGGTPLYTADQLREAQVKVLREAADAFAKAPTDYPPYWLRRMADELEKQG